MRKEIVLVFAFAALVLASVAFAQIPNVEQGNIFTQAGGGAGYGSLANAIIVALSTMVFAVSLIYMAAKIFGQAEWEAYSKSELYQLGVGVMWGVAILAGAVVVDGIVSEHISTHISAGTSGEHTMFGIGQAYLQDVICVSSATTMKLEGMKLLAQYMAGMKSRFYAASYGWGFSFPTFPGFDVIERTIDLLEMFISPFTASLIVQSLGLQIIHATAITIVLPAGILMRIFSPTRDAGSFLIASALAFYFVLPFCYLINAQVMNSMYYEEFGYLMCSGGESQSKGSWLAPKEIYKSLGTQMLPEFSQDVVGTGAFTNHLSYVVVQAVFLPAVNMIMVVTFVTSGMKFFSQRLE